MAKATLSPWLVMCAFIVCATEVRAEQTPSSPAGGDTKPPTDEPVAAPVTSEAPVPPPAPNSAPSAPPAVPSAPPSTSSPSPTNDPAAVEQATVQASPNASPAPAPPASPGGATTTPSERGAPVSDTTAATPKGLALGVELAAGMTAGARFPESQALRSVEEAIDATFGLTVWLGGRGAVYGLSLEHTGLGKDHYATNVSGETMQASYGVDSLSLLGRWYFTKERPAFYLGLSLGAALPNERTTGTRAPEGVFVTPGESYSCSATGRVGGTGALTAGVEFEVASRLAVLADARAAGFLMSQSASSFGNCAPGTGPAFVGAIRVGASYRFGL